MNRMISAIQVQKKNPNRVSIYLDGEYAFGLARIVAAWLRVGQELSEEKIASLKAKDGEEIVFQKAINWIASRPRSEAEVRQKYSAAGVEPLVLDGIVARLRSGGLIDDRQFAHTWVENRSAFRPRSKRVLQMELRYKGLQDEAIQEALQGVDEEAGALQLAQRYSRRLQNADWVTFKQKLGAYLARRGFTYDTVAPLIRQVWENLERGETASEPIIEG